MANQLVENEGWLTLSQAASQLDVHPTTLRRWADNGEIPVMLTPGGHRRFAADDVTSFAHQRHGLRSVRGIGQLWADEALSQTRRELVAHRGESWLATFDDATREHNRLLGRQLMALTLQFIANEDDEQAILQEAHNIGLEYGSSARQSGLLLTEALKASIFFRDTMIETALHLPENVNVRPEANVRLLRRINALLNTVHLAVAEVYDAR
ncbi:MAG: excisionase family DNA-binding protein [Chloroflexi bacterium]|nr:excisionase family DNA-binding protein [Chloroflexota bacterium]MCI0580455.1 excisionase family DNA-binding protein [Chloroflexota bacterium]MCI0649199.1 excisionase family DNA-binding protein [Chloroflexota bacterium]MCI0727989.1 excisionase family DNA-binding protein [Chloroflexota bacterium]